MFAMDAISPITNRVKRNLEESGQIGKVEVQEQTVLEFTHFFDATGVQSTALGISLTGAENFFKHGHVNYIYLDDKLYVYETKHSQQSGFIEFQIGGPKSSGEPFYLRGDAAGSSFLFLYWGELNTTHTIKICDRVETITPIDPKYLPGVCLPVVEISQETFATDISSGAAEIKPNECDQLEAAYAAGLPCVFVSRISDDEFSVTVSNISPLSFVIAADIVAPFYSFSDGFLGERRFYRGVDNVWRMSKSE